MFFSNILNDGTILGEMIYPVPKNFSAEGEVWDFYSGSLDITLEDFMTSNSSLRLDSFKNLLNPENFSITELLMPLRKSAIWFAMSYSLFRTWYLVVCKDPKLDCLLFWEEKIFI